MFLSGTSKQIEKEKHQLLLQSEFNRQTLLLGLAPFRRGTVRQTTVIDIAAFCLQAWNAFKEKRNR